MIAQVQGTVIKSIHPEGKPMHKTAIMQRDEDMQTTVLSTVKGYRPGDKINLTVRITVSEFRGKAYLIIVEETKQGAEKTPVAGK